MGVRTAASGRAGVCVGDKSTRRQCLGQRLDVDDVGARTRRGRSVRGGEELGRVAPPVQLGNLVGEGLAMNCAYGKSGMIDASVKAEGDGIWGGGEILDPNNGKTYRTRLKPVDGGKKLEMRGYIGPFYRTQTWIRVE